MELLSTWSHLASPRLHLRDYRCLPSRLTELLAYENRLAF